MKKYDSTSRKIKSATKGKTIEIQDREEFELEERDGMDKGVIKLTKLSEAEALELAHDKAGGMSHAELSEKFGISKKYVEESLKETYLNHRQGRKILSGIFLEGAIACGMHARAHVQDLTPMQAVVASKVFVSNFLELEKSSGNQSPEVDVENLSEMAKILNGMSRSVEGMSGESGSVLD